MCAGETLSRIVFLSLSRLSHSDRDHQTRQASALNCILSAAASHRRRRPTQNSWLPARSRRRARSGELITLPPPVHPEQNTTKHNQTTRTSQPHVSQTSHGSSKFDLSQDPCRYSRWRRLIHRTTINTEDHGLTNHFPRYSRGESLVSDPDLITWFYIRLPGSGSQLIPEFLLRL